MKAVQNGLDKMDPDYARMRDISKAFIAQAACELEKIGDLSFFQQQDTTVSHTFICLITAYMHQPFCARFFVQGKKKVRKLQKPGAKATGQQKARRGDKHVASEKTTKEVQAHIGWDFSFTCTWL